MTGDGHCMPEPFDESVVPHEQIWRVGAQRFVSSSAPRGMKRSIWNLIERKSKYYIIRNSQLSRATLENDFNTDSPLATHPTSYSMVHIFTPLSRIPLPTAL